MKNRILVVEDDAAIRDAVLLNLQFAGYETRAFEDGADAANALEDDHAFDLALLDIMLPGMDGFELFSVMEHYGIPVIYMTAKTDSASEIKGLRDGAEDYIVKPFEAMELLARIEVVLRRFKKEANVPYYKDIVVDVDKHTVTQSGVVVDLTPKEFDVLVFFLRNQNLAISRDRLLASVWGYEFEGESRTVDIHIQQIRKKLNLKKNLVTIPKLGYRLDSEVTA